MNKDRIAELEKQLDDIKSEIEKLKAEQTEVKPWRAQYDTPYYVLDVCHEVNTVLDWRGNFDDKRYYCGNYYRNKGLAEQDAKELTLRGRIRQLRDALCEGYQFVNNDCNWCVIYNTQNGKFEAKVSGCFFTVGEIYFDTESHAQQVCDILNKTKIRCQRRDENE